MPKLTDEQRTRINERLALHKRIRKTFEGRQYASQYCYLCNWASNGLTLDEAIEANDAHVKTHPEDAEMKVTSIPMNELRDSLHDHDCVYAKCVCKCGCQTNVGCVLVLGPLCSTCLLRAGRGDSEHGEAANAPHSAL